MDVKSREIMNVNAASLSDIKGFLRRLHHADDLLRCFTSAREDEDARLLVKHNRLRFISCSGSSRGTLGQFPSFRHWKSVRTQQAAGTSCLGSRRGRFEDILELCFQTFASLLICYSCQDTFTPENEVCSDYF